MITLSSHQPAVFQLRNSRFSAENSMVIFSVRPTHLREDIFRFIFILKTFQSVKRMNKKRQGVMVNDPLSLKIPPIIIFH